MTKVAFLSIDLVNTPGREQEEFFRYKESQYRQRKERIVQNCKKAESIYPVPVNDALGKFCVNFYNPKHKLSYCPNAKARKAVKIAICHKQGDI